MIKTILYTKNPNFVPTTYDDVLNFAEVNDQFFTCTAKDGSDLYSVEDGAHILSSTGDHIYVLETGGDDYSCYKKVPIRSIAQVDYPFKDNELLSNTNSTKNTIADFSNRLKEVFMPTEAKDVRVSMDGNICVATTKGYVTIDAQNHLTAYPEELTLKLPVFIMSKSKENLVVGDTIALEHGYAKVTDIKGDKITALSYTGTGKSIHTIKDFLFNQNFVRVVVSLTNNMGSQMNPMMLMTLANDGKMRDSLLPLMMMNQQGGTIANNPMMFALLAGNGSISTKDMLIMSMMGGSNPFGNMFGTPANTEKTGEDTED